MSEQPKDTKEPAAAAPGAEKAAPAAKAAAPAKGAPTAKPAAAAKTAPALPLVLIGVVAGALVAGVALGGLLVAPQVNRMRHDAAVAQAADPGHKKDKAKKASSDKKDKKGEAGKAPVYKLDNIIVNPAGSMGQRFLMCSVAIESDDPKTLDTLREHEIELRDRVITMLARQTLDRLTAQNARDSLRSELLAVIKPSLGADAEGADLRVFLPQFVVQ